MEKLNKNTKIHTIQSKSKGGGKRVEVNLGNN
jgi:hypothetical protein